MESCHLAATRGFLEKMDRGSGIKDQDFFTRSSILDPGFPGNRCKVQETMVTNANLFFKEPQQLTTFV